ncbi:MAG TPA: gliding motility-associated ABC transporter permease subunit GldF [Bacteroidales bacterium]|jgi:ABC-2 type transport system permease protein|nr:gliding motility-associated ABC transporter permease subunit GldF [Bacteroidales bacterium]HOF17151.1 gliding motility-associated ABC transporter permease subunit GldF [Bacteroidales bacterium]HON20010.1 gliding motility-associated ABC transporter permease subunit GldF [Bacteroidales bacterium]HOR82916.1 gliding motility-associated ABC transporter permease subunit GldF [Bacteroidales bacterium]HPJ92211.1 gliding motility-associated ABC transporter permease subunit GldF [Bacteroidales bacteri
MYSLFVKEIKSFLSSLIGYIVIGVFLSLTGLFLWIFPFSDNILLRGFADINGLFNFAPVVFLLLIPAITMRSFAEETKSGTIELLLTYPISDMKIILAKFLASIVLLIISLLPTLIYFLTVYFLGYPKGNIDQGAMWGSYLGLIFLGATFASIGIFVSTLTDNQIISFLFSVLLCFIAWRGFEFIYSFDVFQSFGYMVKTLGISHHYESISRGVIDTRDIIYFLSSIVLFLYLAALRLKSRNW